MALTGINPSTFSVPTNQALLYTTNNVYYYKRSNDYIGTVTTNVLSLLGVPTTDLPCLVYDSDLTSAISNASRVSAVGQTTVASAAKAGNAYTKQIGSQKVDKHTYLNELSEVKDALGVRLNAYSTMPDVLSVAQGSVSMYVGPTTEQFTKGTLYVASRINSITISEEVDNAGDMGISAFGECAGTYVYSETVNSCRKFVSSINENFVIVEESDGSYFYLIPSELDFTDFDNAVQQIAVSDLIAGNDWEAGGSSASGESAIINGMYTVEGTNGWEAINTSNVDTEFLMTLIAANTAKVEACEDRIAALETNVGLIMDHLGLN